MTIPFGLDPFTLYTLGRRFLGGRDAEGDQIVEPPTPPVPYRAHAVTPQEEGGPPEPSPELQRLLNEDPQTAGIMQAMKDKLGGQDVAPPTPPRRVPRVASELQHPVVRPEQVRPAAVAPPGAQPPAEAPEPIPGQPAPTPTAPATVSPLTPERKALEREAQVLRLGIPARYGGRLPEGIIRGASEVFRVPARFVPGLKGAVERQERTEEELQRTEAPSALGTVGRFVGGAGASAPLFEGAGRLFQPYSELVAKGLSRIPAPLAPELQGLRAARPLLAPRVVGAGAGLAHATATFMTGSATMAALDAAGRGASAPEIAHAAWEGAVTGVDPTDPVVAAQLALSAYTGLAHAQARATNSEVAARIAEALDLGPEDPLAPAPRTAEVGTAAGEPSPQRVSIARSAALTRRLNAIRMARGGPLPGAEPSLEEPAFTRGAAPQTVRGVQAQAGLPAPRPVRPFPEMAVTQENLEIPTYQRRMEEQFGTRRPPVLPETGKVSPIERRAGAVQPSAPLPPRRRGEASPQELAANEAEVLRASIATQTALLQQGHYTNVEEPFTRAQRARLEGDLADNQRALADAEARARPRGFAEEPQPYLERPYQPLQGKWYSRLERRISEAPFPRGTTQQWQALLSQGVPQGEVEYRGVGKWLSEQDPARVISREELQQHIGPMPVGELRGGRRGTNPALEAERKAAEEGIDDTTNQMAAGLHVLQENGTLLSRRTGEPLTDADIDAIASRARSAARTDHWYLAEQYKSDLMANLAYDVKPTPEASALISQYGTRFRELMDRAREATDRIRAGNEPYGAEGSTKYSEYSHGVEAREGVYSPGGVQTESLSSSRMHYPYELVRTGGAIEPERLAEIPFTERRDVIRAKFSMAREQAMTHLNEIDNEIGRRRGQLDDEAYQLRNRAREEYAPGSEAWKAAMERATAADKEERRLRAQQRRFSNLHDALWEARGTPAELRKAIDNVQAELVPRRLGSKLYGLQEHVRRASQGLAKIRGALDEIEAEQGQLPPVPANMPRPTTIGHFGNIDEEAHRRTEILPMQSGGNALHITELQSDRMQKMRGALPPARVQELLGQLRGIASDTSLSDDQRREVATLVQQAESGHLYLTSRMPSSFGNVNWRVSLEAGGRSLATGVTPTSLNETVGRELAQRAMKIAGVTAPADELGKFFEYYRFPEPVEAKLREILPPLKAHAEAGTQWAMIPRTRTPDWVGLQMRGAIQDAIAKGLKDLTWSTSADLRLRYRKALAIAMRDRNAESIDFVFHGPNIEPKKVTIPRSEIETGGGQGYVTEYDEMMPRIVKEIGKEVGVPLTVDKVTLTPHGVPVKAWHVHIPDNFAAAIEQHGGLRLWEKGPGFRTHSEEAIAAPKEPPITDAATRRLLMKNPGSSRDHLDIRGLQLHDDPVRAGQTLGAALKPWRDPKYEHLHTLLLRDGEIRTHDHSTVHSNVMAAPYDLPPAPQGPWRSSDQYRRAWEAYGRLTDQVEARWIQKLVEQAKRVGANEVAFGHNHPSGDITPSPNDLIFTRDLAAKLAQHGLRLRLALVLDHGEVSLIDPATQDPNNAMIGGMYATAGREAPFNNGWAQRLDVPTTGPDWTDTHGMRLADPEGAAKVAAFLRDANTIKPGMMAVLHIDTSRRVVALVNHRLDALRTMAQWLPQELRAMGANTVALAVDPKDVEQATFYSLVGQEAKPGEAWESLYGAQLPIDIVINAANGHVAGKIYQPGETGRNYRVIPRMREAPVPFKPGEPTPGPITNLDKIEADPEGRQALEQQVEQVVARYGKDALRKIRVPHAQTIAEAKAAGIDLRGLDGEILPSETRAHVLGAGQVISANTARMVEVAKLANDQTLPADQRERAQRALTLLAQQNDHLLYGLIRSKSEGGRLLNSFKILARASLDPALWLQRAAQVAGRALTIDEQTEIGRLLQLRDRDGVVRYVAKLHQTPPLQQFRDLWRAGFLTNPTSLLVAATSDASMQVLETAKDPVAAAADMLMGAFTGQRTKGVLGPIRLAKASLRGAREGIKDAWRTFRGGRQLTTLQEEEQLLRRPPTQVTVFKWRPLNALANAYLSTVFNSYEAKTAFFKAIAFRRSLIEQVELAARQEGLRGVQLRDRLAAVDANLKGDGTVAPIPGFTQMAATAAHDAEVATFQDRTLLGTIASSLTNVPGGEGAIARIQSPGGRAIARGTLETYRTAVTGVLPFTKTPGAIATRAIEYSPLGLARGGIEMIRTILKREHADPGLQRAAAEAIGRGTIGSLLVMLGYRLAQSGQLTPTVQGTTTQQKVARQSGAPGASLLVGPNWRRVGRIAPIGQILAIGSRLYEIAENKGQALGPGETLFQSAMGAGQSMTEMPFMQGVSNITEALKEQPSTTQPLGSKATRFATGYATGLIPSGVQAVHRGLHPEIVQPTNLKEAMTLTGAPVVSPLTGPVKRTGGVAEALFDPFKASADLRQTDPLVKALAEAGYAVPPLPREPGEDPHAFAQRQLKVIPTMRKMLGIAIATPFYQQAARNEQLALSHARGLAGQPAFAGQTVVQIAHQYLRDHDLPSRADLLGQTAAMVNKFYGRPELLRAELGRLRAEREQQQEPEPATAP